MRVIRDDDGFGLFAMALMIDWGLHTTCYVQGCQTKANTIIVADEGTFTLCEKHYQEGNVPGGAELTIVFPGKEG